MKKFTKGCLTAIGVIVVIVVIIFFFVFNVRGSNPIQGDWYATDTLEGSYLMSISDDSIILSDNQNEIRYPYGHNGAGFENRITYTLISLETEEGDIPLTFVSPDPDNEDYAIVMQRDGAGSDPMVGHIVFVLNRDEPLSYYDSLLELDATSDHFNLTE